MFFHGDDLLAVKWRNFKVHFSVRETSRGDVRMPGQQMLTSYSATPNIPWIFNVADDPKELWNIAPANTWVGVPVAKIGLEYTASLDSLPV
jgi:hypothetical protein